MNKGFIIAIDGPVASGKGTIAKKLASTISAINFNSGGIYRAYALKLIRQNIDSLENKKISDYLSPSDVEMIISETDGSFEVLLDGKIVTDALHTPEISMAASHFGTNHDFVEFISQELRRISRKYEDRGQGIIMEGRQIGTDVFPDADVKIFLTADVAVRAERRFEQYQDMGIERPFEEVLKQTKERDEQDMNREFGALARYPETLGYDIIDNSHLSEEETMGVILHILEKKKIWTKQ